MAVPHGGKRLAQGAAIGQGRGNGDDGTGGGEAGADSGREQEAAIGRFPGVGNVGGKRGFGGAEEGPDVKANRSLIGDQSPSSVCSPLLADCTLLTDTDQM